MSPPKGLVILGYPPVLGIMIPSSRLSSSLHIIPSQSHYILLDSLELSLELGLIIPNTQGRIIGGHKGPVSLSFYPVIAVVFSVMVKWLFCNFWLPKPSKFYLCPLSFNFSRWLWVLGVPIFKYLSVILVVVSFLSLGSFCLLVAFVVSLLLQLVLLSLL